MRWEENTHLHIGSCGSRQLGGGRYYHDEFELHYFHSFSGEASVGDYTGAIRPHSLFLLAPNLPHSWSGGPRDSSVEDRVPADFAVLFPEEAILNVFNLFPELRKLEGMLDDAFHGIEFTGSPEVEEVGRMAIELNQMEGCAKIGRFFAILDKLMKCEYQMLASRKPGLEKDRMPNENLNRALMYLNSNFNESITLEQAAGVANMSASHFCRVFKKTYGIGFVDYMNKLRIEQACELLSRTNRPISSIGYECGFSNISNFNRNFRKYINKAPSEFRSAS